MEKIKVCVSGATGTVGQRFLTLLENHPYFEVVLLAASKQSCGKTYREAVQGRWNLRSLMPEKFGDMIVVDAFDVDTISSQTSMVFCAVNLPKQQIKSLEEQYVRAELVVISNNSANRDVPDVPLLIPEINMEHVAVIESQRKRLGTKRGFIAVKPNCSLQSFVPTLEPLSEFGVKSVLVCTYQAISGSGKTFDTWPEMKGNLIPYIAGEEEKTEIEPLKIWGRIKNGEIVNSSLPVISSQCYRVPVLDGHTAAVFVSFFTKPTRDEIIERWRNFKPKTDGLDLPSSPKKFITYFDENDRPQIISDVNIEFGMGISIGRLREDAQYDFKYTALSHNTLRGAAGGAVLMAELLVKMGYCENFC